MSDQTPGSYPEPFLPGGLPLHGRFARFRGVVFACRMGAAPGNSSLDVEVTLIGRGPDSPGPGWTNTPHPFFPARSEWTRAVKQHDTDEAFFCAATARWHGLELGGLEYTPATGLVGGYLGVGISFTHPALERLRGLVRLDPSTLHGQIPLDEMERLEITRTAL